MLTARSPLASKGLARHWGHGLVSLAMIIALGWTAFYLRQKPVPVWLSRFLMVLLLTRFALLMVVIGSDLLFRHFMQNNYQASQQGIDVVSGQLTLLNPLGTCDHQQSWPAGKIQGWMP